MPDVVEPGARVVMSLLGKRPFQNYETNILPHLSHLQSALTATKILLWKGGNIAFSKFIQSFRHNRGKKNLILVN